MATCDCAGCSINAIVERLLARRAEIERVFRDPNESLETFRALLAADREDHAAIAALQADFGEECE